MSAPKKIEHHEFCAQERSLEKVKRKLEKWRKENQGSMFAVSLGWTVARIEAASEELDQAKAEYKKLEDAE